MYPQMSPWSVTNPYLNPAFMQSSGFQVPSPQTVTPQQSWGPGAVQGGIGGAGTGAGIASLLSLSNPWTAAIMLGLGGLGYSAGKRG